MGEIRRPCPSGLRVRLLAEQGYCCAYCLIPFGSVVKKGNRLKLTVVEWDHVLPYAYVQANPEHNWAAACMICNRIKGAEIYTSMDEVREYIKQHWVNHDYECAWYAPVSSAEDGDAWAVKFATYLASLPRRTRVDGHTSPRRRPVKARKRGAGVRPKGKCTKV